ncbi:efflux transporter periplasmic adaptor subunit, partial [Pseudomonas syringae pv. tagetis]
YEVSVDQSSGYVTLLALLPIPEHRLLPGMLVLAQLQAGVNSNAILAPQQGVTRDLKGRQTAMVVNQDKKVEMSALVAPRTEG